MPVADLPHDPALLRIAPPAPPAIDRPAARLDMLLPGNPHRLRATSRSLTLPKSLPPQQADGPAWLRSGPLGYQPKGCAASPDS